MYVIYGCMLARLKKVFRVIFGAKYDTAESKKDNLIVKIVVSAALFAVSLALTIINIITKQTFMMYTTIGLAAVFALCILLLVFFKATKITEVLTAVAICFIFSYYAISGENEGFAILWIVIVPAVASLFLSYKTFLAVAIYFLVFIITIFYTPVKGMIVHTEHYTEQFQIRFPFLYGASFILSIILSTQAIYYSTISHKNSLFDFLTNLKNRRFCNDYLETLGDEKLSPNLTIVSFDLNNLKTINDVFGHAEGDKAIISSAKILNKVFSPKTDKIYRMGGDEFLVFFDDDENVIHNLINEVNKECSKVKIKIETLSLSIGYVKAREYVTADISKLMKISENNMYKNKEEFYKKNNIDRRRKSNLKINLD